MTRRLEEETNEWEHELCHTVHHDHSPRFHALLDRLTGGREKELSRELRRYSIL